MIERSGPPPEFISTTGATYSGPTSNVAFQSPPPPRPPTAIGVGDPNDEDAIFAFIDQMDGPALRAFLRRLSDRYRPHMP